MAVRWLIATGVTSDPANWNGGTLPTASDTCHANGFTGTIDANLTVLGLYTTVGGGAVAGGGFIGPNNGMTLSAIEIKSGSTICLTHSIGTAYVIGNPLGSDTAASLSSTDGIRNTGGVLYVTGNPACGTTTANNYVSCSTGVRNTNGYLEVIGNPVPFAGNFKCSVIQIGTGSTYIKGKVVSGASGTVNFTAHNSSGTMTVDEVESNGITAVDNNVAVLKKMIFSAALVYPGGRWAINATPVITMPNIVNTTVTLSDGISQGQPSPADVRSGVVYANATLTGTCAVPPAGSVSLGVPVDATTGTGSVTSAEIRDLILPSILSAITAP